MRPNIVLIGFMGAGKSTVGRMLAEKLQKRFIEIDGLIERKAGQTIQEIFEEEGEVRFRELEIEATKELAEKKNVVISCGGGLALNRINVVRLRKNGLIVLLTAPLDLIKERVSGDSRRPLLKKDLSSLLEKREPFYNSAADITVETDCSVKKVVDTIMREYYEYNR
ncbi:MAG: shikimate kinase [Euryarchaeota archaeon]|nr:shikimate kinase [Euryarchaeota archaeon]